MHNNSQHRRDAATVRCPICDGRFGLMRHYCWKTAFCSERCVGRFKARQNDDRKWLSCPSGGSRAPIIHFNSGRGA